MKTKKTTTKRKSKKRKQMAGDFVKTGSYGCVFRPPLKCTDSELNSKFSAGFVSKLMKNNAFRDEINEVESVSKIFDKRDDEWQKKYFVLPLNKDGCTINVNDSTNELDIKDSNLGTGGLDPCLLEWPDISARPTSYKSLNMVDGGKDLNDVLVKKGILTTADFNVINNLMIDLLVNGIYEMNHLGIYHFDIKAGNIVYNEHDGRMRLIDWGFVKHIDKRKIHTQHELEQTLRRLKSLGTLYYGAHYGHALLSSDFKALRQSRHATTAFKAYLMPHKLGYMPLFTYYPEHVSDILVPNYNAIVEQSKLDYFKKVYLPNSDIFAFLIIYLTISGYLESSKIRENINNLINTYILSDTYSKNPYNIENLEYSLRNLSNSVGSPTMPSQSPRASVSPNTVLLNNKLAENKITLPEYNHLIKMNESRKALSPALLSPLSAFRTRHGTASGIKRSTRKRRGASRRRHRLSQKRRHKSRS
jgi:serine/threonine protein kinase